MSPHSSPSSGRIKARTRETAEIEPSHVEKFCNPPDLSLWWSLLSRVSLKITSPSHHYWLVVPNATGSKFVPAQFHGAFRYNIDPVSCGTLKWPIITMRNLLLLLKRIQQVSDICCRLLKHLFVLSSLPFYFRSWGLIQDIQKLVLKLEWLWGTSCKYEGTLLKASPHFYQVESTEWFHNYLNTD